MLSYNHNYEIVYINYCRKALQKHKIQDKIYITAYINSHTYMLKNPFKNNVVKII